MFRLNRKMKLTILAVLLISLSVLSRARHIHPHETSSVDLDDVIMEEFSYNEDTDLDVAAMVSYFSLYYQAPCFKAFGGQ